MGARPTVTPRRFRGVAVVFTAALVVAGATPLPADAASATTVRQAYRRASGGGVSLNVPADWSDFSLDSPTAKRNLEAFLRANPKLGFDYEQMVAQNVVILAIGRPRGGFADNINVIVSDSGGATTITQADLAGLEQQYTRIGGTVLRSRLITVQGKPAARVEYQLTANRADGGRQTVQGTQIVVLSGRKLAFVTVSQGTRDPAVVAEIVSSLRVS